MLPDDSWKGEADKRIEEIRKSDVVFNFLDVDARELVLEVDQLSQRFPFGQAVNSKSIAGCYLTGADDGECSFIRNNYNMIVDTFR